VYPSDPYLTKLEEYIGQLHNHLLKIQDLERKKRAAYAKDLANVEAAQVPDQRGRTPESKLNAAFASEMDAIRERRAHFRRLLYDAYQQRKMLLEAMRIQREEDEYLRKKLQLLSAVDEDPSERLPTIDVFAVVFLIAEILTIITFLLVTDYSSNKNAFGENNGAPFRVANDYTLWIHISMFALLGFGLLYTFMRKYAYTALGSTLLIVVWVFQLSILWRTLWRNVESDG